MQLLGAELVQLVQQGRLRFRRLEIEEIPGAAVLGGLLAVVGRMQALRLAAVPGATAQFVVARLELVDFAS